MYLENHTPPPSVLIAASSIITLAALYVLSNIGYSDLINLDFIDNNKYLALTIFLTLVASVTAYAFESGSNKKIKSKTCYYVNISNIRKLMNFSAFISFVIVVIVQYNLGVANYVNVLLGGAGSADIEAAILNSPPGLHGFALLWAYFNLILSDIARRSNLKGYSWYLCLIFSMFIFIGTGKLQGLIYFIFFYLGSLKSKRAWLMACLKALVVVLILFFITRFLRNQDQNLTFNFDLIVGFLFGAYLGAPFANSEFIFNNLDNIEFSSLYYINLIPKRFDISDIDIINQLPDPTSPVGLVGSGLLLGTVLFAVSNAAFCGAIMGLAQRASKYYFPVFLFMPFVYVAAALSVMYNHVLNLTFFLLPFFLCLLLSNLLVSKKIVNYEN